MKNGCHSSSYRHEGTRVKTIECPSSTLGNYSVIMDFVVTWFSRSASLTSSDPFSHSRQCDHLTSPVCIFTCSLSLCFCVIISAQSFCSWFLSLFHLEIYILLEADLYLVPGQSAANRFSWTLNLMLIFSCFMRQNSQHNSLTFWTARTSIRGWDTQQSALLWVSHPFKALL